MLSATMSFAVVVGVLGNTIGCPDRFVYSISLDAEDHNNISGLIEGPRVPYGVNFSLGRVNFLYCKMSSEYLQPVPYDYVLVRMDEECPAGGYKFRRHHDTEDKNNDNTYNGNIWPSVVGKDVDLEYCFMPATPNATASFPVRFFGGFGVFGNYSNDTTHILHSKILVDDEDSKNANSWEWYGQGGNTALLNRIKRIVGEQGKDTFYNLTFRDPANLCKRGEESPIFAENAAADKPVAAELKGFDHSTVAFEIKSAGNVVVSIVNMNGAVVAKVSRENLQPGIHRVEWHSGIVPNGRYVVTIEHNGVTSGKNVILK